MANTKPQSETPTKPASPPAKPKDKGKADGRVLVFNDHLGPQVMTFVQKKEGAAAPKGAAKADVMARMDVTRIVIHPGLWLLSPEEWTKLERNGGFANRVQQGLIIVLGGSDAKIPWHEDWLGLRSFRRIEYVGDSSHPETLKACLEHEENDEVREAIETQIGELDEATMQQRIARNTQRGINRRSNRRARGRR